MLELMARSATSGRDILSPMEKRPLSQWGGGLSAKPTWSAIQRPHGSELHTEHSGRATEHETTRPRSPNRSPLPALPTHPTPAMLTCDARPRSLSGNSTKMKLDPHNYNFKKKTCIGPPPPERIQNPPKNSRNRSGPRPEIIRHPERNYPQTGNYSPTSNRCEFTAGTLLLSIKELEIYASRKREHTRRETPARRQIEKYGAPKLGDYRQVPARVWVDPIFLIRTTNRSSKRARSRRPRKGKRRPKKARPATARTALGTTTHRAQQAHRRERSEWRVARRKRRRRDDG